MPLSRTQPLTVWYPMALFTRTRIKVPKDILLPTFQQIIFILLFTALPKDSQVSLDALCSVKYTYVLCNFNI